jgi:GntR family carbon starvation induced transcriptional regulator
MAQARVHKQAVTGGNPPPAGTLTTVVSDRLRDDILNGRRPPGAKIRLEELKSEFGISWSPIREALSRLTAEGLLLAEDQRGYRVAPASRDDLAEVIRLRVLLEPMALAMAIDNGGDAWEAAIITAHHHLGKVEDQRDGTQGSVATDWETRHRGFHDALIAGSASPILLQFCHMLHDMNDRYRRIFLKVHAFDRDVAGEHISIFDAALARDGRKATALLKSHIERTGRNILASMRE